MTSIESKAPRCLIVGCGGIGGVLAANLWKTGVDVSICTTNEKVRRTWATTGPYLNGRLSGHPLPTGKILASPEEARELFDLAFVAVQPPQIESVAAQLKNRLSEGARVICLSNGLCEERLAKTLGEARVIGAVVAWGARMPQPGHYERTSSGGFLVGTLSGRADAKMGVIVPLLSTTGPVTHTLNLRGARLSKLVINCAISALGTLGGTTLGSLLMRKDVRKMGIELMREAAAVARAEGIELERIANIDISRVVQQDPSRRVGRAAQHAVLLAVGARYRRLRSSMLAAIERGREPAVNFINGEVCALGDEHNIATPYNDAAVDVIWRIYRGELSAGDDALQAFERRARAA